MKRLELGNRECSGFTNSLKVKANPGVWLFCGTGTLVPLCYSLPPWKLTASSSSCVQLHPRDRISKSQTGKQGLTEYLKPGICIPEGFVPFCLYLDLFCPPSSFWQVFPCPICQFTALLTVLKWTPKYNQGNPLKSSVDLHINSLCDLLVLCGSLPISPFPYLNVLSGVH